MYYKSRKFECILNTSRLHPLDKVGEARWKNAQLRNHPRHIEFVIERTFRT